MLNAIVAIANNNVIGRNNKLPWHLPDDLHRFQKITFGKTIIMGSNTFKSVGILPYRKTIVLTHENVPGYSEEITFINNIDKIDSYMYSDQEYFVIGGAQIYEIFLPYVQKLYVTRIYEDFAGDTFFPDIKYSEWQLISEEKGEKNKNNPYNYDYLIYEKKFNELYCNKNKQRAGSLGLECWQACNLTCAK